LNSKEHSNTENNLVEFQIGTSKIGPNDYRYHHYLSYGQIIALSGDYFRNFDQLKSAPLHELIDILQSDTFRFDIDHFDPMFFLQQPIAGLRYYDLASHNPEHFRGCPEVDRDNLTRGGSGYISNPDKDDSVIRYKQGHQSAVSHALVATDESSHREAYAINAFYDHFMTDMFSAGHMRVPRRQLHGEDLALMFLDLYTARACHEEDGSNGLWVTNKNEDSPWFALGDGHQDPKDKDHPENEKNENNWNKCLAAVKESVAEITLAISSKTSVKPDDFAALKMKPEVFPPGAEVYDTSKLSDYKVKMNPSGKSNSVDCWLMGYAFPDNTKGVFVQLVIPNYLLKRYKKSVGGWDLKSIWTNLWRLDQGKLSIETVNKRVYELTTTSTKKSGSKQGVQTYPIYLIANGRLMVRLSDSGDTSVAGSNEYVSAEYDLNDVDSFDRDSPPPMSIRLPGDQQGVPIP